MLGNIQKIQLTLYSLLCITASAEAAPAYTIHNTADMDLKLCPNVNVSKKNYSQTCKLLVLTLFLDRIGKVLICHSVFPSSSEKLSLLAQRGTVHYHSEVL